MADEQSVEQEIRRMLENNRALVASMDENAAKYERMLAQLAAKDAELERLWASLQRYGDALEILGWPIEGKDTIQSMAEVARRALNPSLYPPRALSPLVQEEPE